MYKPNVTEKQVLELWEQGGIGKQEAYEKLAKKQVMEDYDLANTLRKAGIECQSFDIFDIIEYALFKMKR